MTLRVAFVGDLEHEASLRVDVSAASAPQQADSMEKAQASNTAEACLTADGTDSTTTTTDLTADGTDSTTTTDLPFSGRRTIALESFLPPLSSLLA